MTDEKKDGATPTPSVAEECKWIDGPTGVRCETHEPAARSSSATPTCDMCRQRIEWMRWECEACNPNPKLSEHPANR